MVQIVLCCTHNDSAFKVNVLKFEHLKFLFLFSNEMLVVKAEIHKMFVRIANREHPDQTASAV